MVLCVSRKGPRFMMALVNLGLSNLGELSCWIFLVVGGSGIVGFMGIQGGLSVVRAKLVTEEPRHQRITLIGPFGSQGI